MFNSYIGPQPTSPIIRLHQPELPENELKRIAQVLTDKTKLKAYRQCMVGEEHKAPTVGGHLIPESWLKKICANRRVVMFVSHPIGLFKGLELAPDEYSVPVQKPHISNATKRQFTCQLHECLFSLCDSPKPDTKKLEVLNLMAYKAILAQLWDQRLSEKAVLAALKETPDNEVFQVLTELSQKCVIGLKHYKGQVEQCLHPDQCCRCNGGQCRVISHVVRHIPGIPTLAVSEFTSGDRTIVDVHQRIQYMTQWGLTVFPIERGHTAVLHYFPEESGVSCLMDQTVTDFRSLNGKRLQAMLSALILGSCENFAISPTIWEKFGPKRRYAIMQRYKTDMPYTGIGTMEQIARGEIRRFMQTEPLPPNHQQLNLFSH